MNQPEILLVEDSELDAMIITQMFNKINLKNNVMVVADERKLLEFFTDFSLHTPKIILLDLGLPEINGRWFLKKLKTSAHTKHIRVIIVSAESDQEVKDECMFLGADAYITKPFTLEEFGSVVAPMGFYWQMLDKDEE